MNYLLNKELDCILLDWKGNPFDGTEFQYLSNPFKPDWKVVLTMLASRNPQAKQKRQDKWRPKIHLG